MASGEPDGYIYQADLLCPGCGYLRASAMIGQAMPYDASAEDLLDVWARKAGVNRSDEGSFDSDNFPKLYAGTPHDGCYAANGYERGQCGDRCGDCGEFLGGDCPNVA